YYLSHSFFLYFFFNDPSTTKIYTLSLHDALPIFIKRIWIMPHISGQERRTNPASINPISVGLYPSRVTRMETIPSLVRLEHTNGSRERVIERLHQILRWNRRFSCETCHLSQGVHTRIGPAGTLRQYFFRSDTANS